MRVFVRKLAGSMHPPTRKYSSEISAFFVLHYQYTWSKSASGKPHAHPSDTNTDYIYQQ